jgi:type II secretion system protein G
MSLFTKRGADAGKSRGFTLIELLVVIAIIGILSSIVLASLNSARQKGRDARRVSDIKQLQLALELYYDSNQTYPASPGTGADSIEELVTDGFISTIPTDPNGSDYLYAGIYAGSGSLITNCTSYHLGAVLEDSGNIALGGDADADDRAECTGSADFHGDTPDCTGDIIVASDSCYDVIP